MKLKFAAAGLAAACIGQVLAAPAPVGAAGLLRLVFPGWQDDDKGRMQDVTLPPNPDGWGDDTEQTVRVDPKLLIATSPDTVTLVAGMAPAEVAHPTPMGLSAYYFRRSGGKWTLEAKQEGFGYEGYFAEAALRQIALAPRIAAIGAESGTCWQGYCMEGISIYRLDAGKVAPKPVARIVLGGYDYNAAGDCRRRLLPLVTLEPGDLNTDDGVPPESHACYKISATWSVGPSTGAQPGDLTIHFTGALSPASIKPGPPRRIDQKQVMRYVGGEYRVISGDNPIPSI
jgi:hypothetical protein